MRVKTRAFGLALLILASIWHTAISEGQIQLTRDGGTNCRIMVGPGASPVEAFASQELQGYVMQISGVFLPMVSGSVHPGEKLILVGKDAVDMLGLGIDESRLAQDGFVIKTAGNKIILAGGSPEGTLYSVYAFLEMLGCRWLAPGILGEVIPRRSDITVPSMDHSQRPGFKYRGFTNLIPIPYEGVQWIDWMAKNRMNYIMVPQHNYPDFMEILGGELEKRGMDIGISFHSSTSVEQIFQFTDSNPEVEVIAFYEPPPEAKEYGNLVFLAQPDQIAERCYRHSLDDGECQFNREIREGLEDRLGSWNRTHIHEYYMGSYSQNSLPFPILHTIAQDIKYLSELGSLEGVISQCEPGNWGAYGLNYYVFARMAWSSEGELGSIVDDYCEKYYGTAGGPMKRYFAILEDSMAATEHFRHVDPPQLILKLLNEMSLAEMEAEIQSARELASDAMTFDRLRKTELSLEHTKLLWNMLNRYSRGIQTQENGENEEAMEHFQQTADLGEQLVAFLFRNIDEGVYLISVDYIFEYLEPLITDARHRKELIGME